MKPKRILVFLAILLIVAGSFYSCAEKENNIANYNCDNKKILKVLKDEPAYVQKSCFDHVGRVDTFYFQLTKRYPEFFTGDNVFPAGEIPQQFREEGLSVYISGNVTSCIVIGGCMEPNIRLAYIHLFELKSIKIKK